MSEFARNAVALLEQPVDSPAATQAVPSIEHRSGDRLIEAELLVEEISIDGMCGVY